MIVNVTEDHIKTGVRGDPLRCPVSRALRDATGELWRTSSSGVRACEHDDSLIAETLRRLSLSKEIGDKIDQFDLYGKMLPFSMYVPDKTPAKHQTTFHKIVMV